MQNRFLLIKCIVLGGFCFPSPFLIIFYVRNQVPAEFMDRWLLVMFLILSGCLIGVVAYYKDSALAKLKDWFPSQKDS